MGQKSNPRALRLGISQGWDAAWYAEKQNYGIFLYEDFQIRQYILQEFSKAGVARVIINRKSDYTEIVIYISRPGIVFGKNAVDTTVYKEYLLKKLNKKIEIKILEEKRPDLNAKLIGEWVCFQLEKRVPFRRAMKMAVQRVMKAGAEGVRIACAGRLGGVEIARTEWYLQGKVPLHTLRNDIDFAISEALTTYGKIGVKVWVNTGQVKHPKSGDSKYVNA